MIPFLIALVTLALAAILGSAAWGANVERRGRATPPCGPQAPDARIGVDTVDDRTPGLGAHPTRHTSEQNREIGPDDTQNRSLSRPPSRADGRDDLDHSGKRGCNGHQ